MRSRNGRSAPRDATVRSFPPKSSSEFQSASTDLTSVACGGIRAYTAAHSKSFAFMTKGDSMMFGSRRIIPGVVGSLAGCLLLVGLATGQAGQAPTAQTQPMAEQVFKKVDLLKGILV